MVSIPSLPRTLTLRPPSLSLPLRTHPRAHRSIEATVNFMSCVNWTAAQLLCAEARDAGLAIDTGNRLLSLALDRFAATLQADPCNPRYRFDASQAHLRLQLRRLVAAGRVDRTSLGAAYLQLIRRAVRHGDRTAANHTAAELLTLWSLSGLPEVPGARAGPTEPSGGPARASTATRPAEGKEGGVVAAADPWGVPHAGSQTHCEGHHAAPGQGSAIGGDGGSSSLAPSTEGSETARSSSRFDNWFASSGRRETVLQQDAGAG